MSRTILHMDGDAFFVACEVAKNPSLRGRPVVTGEERGIVSALSYEAKALGIIRGMPVFKLKKEFPQVLILPGDYACYAKYSRDMFDIVHRYTDEVEEYSIDECFADLTGYDRPLKMSYEEIGKRIKKEVTNELGLSVSVGLGPSKSLAKVASKWQKPDGFTMIREDNINAFLAKVSIEKVWGIGPRTSDTLRRLGVLTAEDFVSQKIEWVRENFAKPYEVIWLELHGVPISKINKEIKSEYHSVQKTRSFNPSTRDKVFLLSELSKNIELACNKVRYYDLVPSRISFFLKDRDFKYHNIELRLSTPTNVPEMLVPLIYSNFYKIYKEDVFYRTTGVTLSGLVPGEVSQMDLFGGSDKSKKFEEIHKQIDKLEGKFGRHAVYLASTHKSLKNKKIGTDAEELDRDLLFL